MDNSLLTKKLIKRAIELCSAVYRVTKKFPQGEVLRHKLREKSLEVIESIIYDLSNPAKGNFLKFARREQIIQNLLACFAIAEQQNWVNKRNFRILEKEYAVLCREANERKSSRIQAKNEEKRLEMNERQKKIIQLLKEHNEGVNLGDIAEFLELSRRSAKRELKPLIEGGVAVKEGITKGAKFFTASRHN